MTSKAISIRNRLLASLLVVSMMGVVCVCLTFASAQNRASTIPAGAPSSASIDLKGAWSGTLFPKHSNVAPFTITVVVGPNDDGNLVGTATLSSDCLKDAPLEITVNGAKVVLAGSDESGNNITVRGILDKAGTLLRATYILNGSATGRCESETGTGTLAKRP